MRTHPSIRNTPASVFRETAYPFVLTADLHKPSRTLTSFAIRAGNKKSGAFSDTSPDYFMIQFIQLVGFVFHSPLSSGMPR